MLVFDADATRFLDDIYLGADFARRRRANFDALDPGPGERILDLGCGPGHLTQDLARAVGPGGRVVGLDPSAAMREAAEERCRGMAAVEIREGTAQALPFDGASFDKAVAVQVFEYLDDLAPPLAELHRVLRPGGQAVIGDMHFDTLAWHSADPGRMARMMRAWDRHLADRTVPAKLPALMRDAGFRAVRSIPLTFCDTALRPDGLARMMIILMATFARQSALLPEAEIAAWQAEQEDLARTGRFFMTLTHFVTVARRD